MNDNDEQSGGIPPEERPKLGRTLEEILAEWNTPEARAQLEAEAELFIQGKMELVSIDEVLQEMERRQRERPGGSATQQ